MSTIRLNRWIAPRNHPDVVSKSLDAEPPDVPHGALSVLAALLPWPIPASLLFQASRISSKQMNFFNSTDQQIAQPKCGDLDSNAVIKASSDNLHDEPSSLFRFSILELLFEITKLLVLWCYFLLGVTQQACRVLVNLVCVWHIGYRIRFCRTHVHDNTSSHFR